MYARASKEMKQIATVRVGCSARCATMLWPGTLQSQAGDVRGAVGRGHSPPLKDEQLVLLWYLVCLSLPSRPLLRQRESRKRVRCWGWGAVQFALGYPRREQGQVNPPVFTEAGLAKEKVKLEIGLQLPERDRKGISP